MSPVLLGRVSGSQAFASLASLRRVSREVFEPTYVDDVFSTYVYEGTGVANTITNGIDLSGEGGLVWIKNRVSTAYNHCLFDTERGATKHLTSNSSAWQFTTTNSLTGFNSDGFDLGSYGDVNANTSDFCSWTFRKAPGFFDVVTWTGNSVNGRQIAHSLGSVPGMIIVKRTSQYANWEVWHNSFGNDEYMALNSDNDKETSGGPWNNTAPTSTHFTVSSDSDVNLNNETYVAYLFGHNDASFGTNEDEVIIKCGSYTGNGSATGPEIDLGFEPQFILVKLAVDADELTGPWVMLDAMRNGEVFSNVTNGLNANNTNSESAFSPNLGVTAMGFQPRTTSSYANRNGSTYIYMAIRRPHKPPEDGTDVFAIDTSDATSPSPPQFTSGFVTDFIIRKTMDGANNQVGSRLQGVKYMSTYSENQGSAATLLTWDFMDGWSNSSGVDTDLFCYMLKRAPGFMDVVTYVGNGTSGRTVSHNLGVVPELIIVKGINYTGVWAAYSSVTGNANYLRLNTRDPSTSTSFWNSTTPTSTQFTLGNNNNVNGSYNYVAYLFSSLDGISKVGSYTGTGSDIDVDCGFSAGARFVMIKRTDTEVSGTYESTWYIWDTTNGIVSGNDDPYWVTHSAVAEVTNTDFIDPLNAGFTVNSSAPDALNVSGGTYLFFAIA